MNIEGNTPLHLAAEAGHVSAVLVLVVDLGCAVDVKNAAGKSPLDLATSNTHTDVAEILAQKLKQ